jgi:hypothetical protein
LASELLEAFGEFESNYTLFLKKNQKYILIDDQLEINFPERTTTHTIEDTAACFGESIRKIQEVNERKEGLTEKKWTTQFSNFLSNSLHSQGLRVIWQRLSLRSFRLYSEFWLFTPQLFVPLKGNASCLGVILQILEDEAGRAEDFRSQLRVIEFQAALIADNPNYDLSLESTQKLLENASTECLRQSLKSSILPFYIFAADFSVCLVFSSLTISESLEDHQWTWNLQDPEKNNWGSRFFNTIKL